MGARPCVTATLVTRARLCPKCHRCAWCCFGGVAAVGNQPLNTSAAGVWDLNTATWEWTFHPASLHSPSPYDMTGAFSLNAKVFVLVGECSKLVQCQLQEFDPFTSQWKSVHVSVEDHGMRLDSGAVKHTRATLPVGLGDRGLVFHGSDTFGAVLLNLNGSVSFIQQAVHHYMDVSIGEHPSPESRFKHGTASSADAVWPDARIRRMSRSIFFAFSRVRREC